MTNSRDVGISSGAGKGDAPRHNQEVFDKNFRRIKFNTPAEGFKRVARNRIRKVYK